MSFLLCWKAKRGSNCFSNIFINWRIKRGVAEFYISFYSFEQFMFWQKIQRIYIIIFPSRQSTKLVKKRFVYLKQTFCDVVRAIKDFMKFHLNLNRIYWKCHEKKNKFNDILWKTSEERASNESTALFSLFAFFLLLSLSLSENCKNDTKMDTCYSVVYKLKPYKRKEYGKNRK